MILSAALAYYTIFSLAPLLVIAIAAAGLIFGKDASQRELFNSLSGLLGPNGAAAVAEMLKGAGNHPAQSVGAAIIGALTLFLGAGGVFTQLQDALNMIWKAGPPQGSGFKYLIRQRLLSFAMVLGIAFLLLVSLVISTALSALGQRLGNWQMLNFLLSFGATAALFGLIFKVLPDVKLEYRDVAHGAVFTALLFALGKSVIGLYLGKSTVASSFGAAGSLAVVMVWVFYSSAILFLGAEFTKAYALDRRAGGESPRLNKRPVLVRGGGQAAS